MCSDMNQPMTRRSAHDVGDAWTTVDATETYEIARWGQGYFSIGDNGHVKIHPTKELDRSIDLKQLIDHLQLRGISLPVLVRFRGENSLHVWSALIRPRTYLQVPVDVRGNMNSHASHRTSGFGAGL